MNKKTDYIEKLLRTANVVNVKLAIKLAKSQSYSLDHYFSTLDAYFNLYANYNETWITEDFAQCEVNDINLNGALIEYSSKEKQTILDAFQYLNPTEIYMPNNAINNLPKSFKKLDNLITLNLYSNYIEDYENLPKNIEALTLTDNYLQNLDPHISNLKNLKLFFFGKNDITELPDWITKMDNLKKISMASMKLKKLPNNIFESNIEELFIANNHISQLPPIPKNSKIRIISIGGNNVKLTKDIYDTPLSVVYMSGDRDEYYKILKQRPADSKLKIIRL